MALVKVTRWAEEVPYVHWFALDEPTFSELDRYVKTGEAPEAEDLVAGLMSYHVESFGSAFMIGPTTENQRARESLVAGYIVEFLAGNELSAELELDYSWR